MLFESTLFTDSASLLARVRTVSRPVRSRHTSEESRGRRNIGQSYGLVLQNVLDTEEAEELLFDVSDKYYYIFYVGSHFLVITDSHSWYSIADPFETFYLLESNIKYIIWNGSSLRLTSMQCDPSFDSYTSFC